MSMYRPRGLSGAPTPSPSSSQKLDLSHQSRMNRERATRREEKRQLASMKKPAFVSTVKTVIPPYVPESTVKSGSSGSSSGSSSELLHTLQVSFSENLDIGDLKATTLPYDIEDEATAVGNEEAPTLYHSLLRKSVRWLQLSNTYRSLIIASNLQQVNSNSLDAKSVAQFIDVMNWRIHGNTIYARTFYFRPSLHTSHILLHFKNALQEVLQRKSSQSCTTNGLSPLPPTPTPN